MSIDAPEWTYRGVRPDGVPEQQISLVRTQKSASGEASYDRQDLQTIVAIDRDLELGLTWQIHNKASRLSPTGKAITLRVPLVAGENVLSENAVVRDGSIEIQMGANDSEFAWDSELPITDRIKLATNAGNSWVERWKMVASPVWNLAISGLAPIFEPGNPELVPVWRPWPGEAVDLAISRPEAIAGPTITVLRGTREIAVGNRQRVSKLDLSVRCSLGQDFLTELPADAEITLLTHNGEALPARKDGTKLVIPLRPGEQSLSVGWKINVPLGFRVTAGEVRLPVESANINTSMGVPDDRWILWAAGPQRGPAVRFWSILLCAVIAAWILGRVAVSPLRPLEWMLLAIGLTQVPLPASLVVVGWLFFLAWRGRQSFLDLPYVGLQLAAGFSRCPHRRRAFHSRGRRGARPAWQSRNVHRRKRVRANHASLVFGSGGYDFATPLLLVGFDVVVSLSDARLGALDCRGADSLASLGLATIQRGRMLQEIQTKSPHSSPGSHPALSGIFGRSKPTGTLAGHNDFSDLFVRLHITVRLHDLAERKSFRDDRLQFAYRQRVVDPTLCALQPVRNLDD